MGYDYNEISKIYDDVREADFETAKFIAEKLKGTEKGLDMVRSNGKGKGETKVEAKNRSGRRVLEIGCGTANYLRLVHQLTQAEVWGLDQSQGMLDKARTKCENAVLVEDDAVTLSKLPDDHFDVVYMVDVIHHIEDIGTMFRNIRRVLKDQGMILIFSDNHDHIRNRLTTRYFPETLDRELERYQDTPELMEGLSNEGFRQMDSGVLDIGKDFNYGQRLIDIASNKGYSMFGMISDGAIIEGIERIKEDMAQEPVVYHRKAPYVMAVK